MTTVNLGRPPSELTLAQFENLVKRMYKAFEVYEKVLEYRDESSCEIVKGQTEYSKYLIRRQQVESHAGAFQWMKVVYPDG
jgi:hypothetical protein